MDTKEQSHDVEPSEQEGEGDKIDEAMEGKVTMKRQVTLLAGISLIVGTMIGSGIFASPVGVLRQTESVGMSLIIWLLCGLVSTFGALSYAELGTMIPKSGAEFPYLYDTYGPPMAFVFAWVSILLTRPSSLSIIALTFAEYAVQPFYPDAECEAPVLVLKLMACVCVILLTIINCLSVKASTNIQVVFTAAKLLALLIIIVTGFVKIGQGNTEYLDPKVSFQGSSSDIFAYGIAFYQGLWAYDGWNQLNFITEELVNPERNIPLAIVIGIPLVTIVYLLTNIAYFAVMSPEEMLTSSAVAITFANRTLGPAAWIIPVFVCCSTFGAANGTLFTSSRLAYVAGREGHTIQILSMVNPALFTPIPALLFTSVIAIVMLIPNDFDTLVNYFSFATWMFYGLTTAAVVVLRIRHPEWRRPVKVPLILPILVALMSVYLVIAPIIDAPELGYLYAGIFILAGLFLYYPLVYKDLSPGFMDSITVFFQQLLQVAPTYLRKDIKGKDDSEDDTSESSLGKEDCSDDTFSRSSVGKEDGMELVERRSIDS